MKTDPPSSIITDVAAETSAPRYQIYRQIRTGHYLPGYRSDSAPDSVEAFLNQAPAFDGGGVHLLDLHERRVVASVAWSTEKTDFGFPVHHRVDRFLDVGIERLAEEIRARETLRLELRREAPLPTGV